MYVNVDGPFSSTPPAIRKSLFREFSGGGGAPSLFNLRQKRSVIGAEGRGGPGRLLCEGISIERINSSFYLKGIAFIQNN